MKEAALELRKAGYGDEIIQFGVSVDGTWQRRGHSYLNGCASAISIDNGKILDIELMSKICRFCIKETSANGNSSHNYAKHTATNIGILPGRGRKQIPSSSVEDVPTAVVEASSQSPHGSPEHLLRDGDSEVRTTFAPPHINRRVKQFLRQHFTDARVISRHFPTAWPPRSPDSTTCDFWLWGFLRDNIYRKRPASLPDLKDSIRRHVRDIPADSLRSAVENMVLRLEHIVEKSTKEVALKLLHMFPFLLNMKGDIWSNFNATF
ncbi:hypothetical protein AVEN_132714-1 [Araneus ventricosus]|uniref:Mutator-like transposase domain-containing protein n=1 Tax=Araneus ventricosus TaxID=182803 RepID=A0A4Y2AUY2_ARAVE|nr:hypothetical protein AVEN_132714-1 [Araneus ventricosus]